MKQHSWVLAITVVLCLAGNVGAQNIGVGGHVSSLGFGGDVAFRVTERANIRGSFNFFHYDQTFDKDGIHYDGHVTLGSAEADLDWFPFHGGFHLSPGLVVYNGNEADTDASVPGGHSFTLGGTTYTSSTTVPISGTGEIDFIRVAPAVRVGWGNLIPRNGRRISVPFEVGVIFHGTPTSALNLTGMACDPSGRNCVDASNPIIQSSMRLEEAKINSSISWFKVYPVISVGFGYSF